MRGSTNSYTVSADDVRQKPKSIAVDVNSVATGYADDRFYDGYVIKNG